MPTASKLVAAIAFAILAWFTSELIKPLLPDGTPVGLFSPGNAIIGFISGWKIMGTRSGEGMRVAIGGGLTTSAAMVFWGLLVYSIIKMIKLSLRKYYGDPLEAVVGVFQLAMEYGRLIATPEIVITLVVGGILGGWLAEKASQRWP